MKNKKINMELKNITTFREFVFEATGEFSNNTKFSESLVGRGIFSLLRYMKQGIDSMRLEYLKRKLENEYFAGVLRLCALKKIDLKTGEMPEDPKDDEDNGDSSNPTPTPTPSPDDTIGCIILHMDYTTGNALQDKKREFEETLNNLIPYDDGSDPELTSYIQTIKDFIAYCTIKSKMNIEVFKVLETTYATETGRTYLILEATAVIELLNKIVSFLEGYTGWAGAKIICPKYNLTVDERNVIKIINQCTNTDIKDICNKILTVLTTEKFKISKYNKINEAVNSKINMKIPIAQILGDVLAVSGGTLLKVDPYEYLKTQNINDVSEINFQALSETWKTRSLMGPATSMVNEEAVKQIQYTASRMIYRVKKTPTYTGITPEKGGGVNYDEDSALRTLWERKIQTVKSEWMYFLDMGKVDPFILMNYQDALRKRDANYDKFKKDVVEQTEGIANAAEWSKYGIKLLNKNPDNDNSLYVVNCSINSVSTYIAFKYCQKNGRKTYTYVGTMKLKEIVDGKIDKSLFKDYSKSIMDGAGQFSNGFETFLNAVGIHNESEFRSTTSGQKSIAMINFFTNSYRSIPTKITTNTPSVTNPKIVSLYITEGSMRHGGPNGIFSELPPTGLAATDLEFKTVNNGRLENLTNDVKLAKTIPITFGLCGEMDDTYIPYYFPNLSTHPKIYHFLNEDIINPLVVF